jgi:hypothetical protein
MKWNQKKISMPGNCGDFGAASRTISYLGLEKTEFLTKVVWVKRSEGADGRSGRQERTAQRSVPATLAARYTRRATRSLALLDLGLVEISVGVETSGFRVMISSRGSSRKAYLTIRSSSE